MTPAPNKLAAYDELELLRDESHTRALALDQLKAMGNGLGLSLLREEFFRVDIGVEALLAASFPAPGKSGGVPPQGARGRGTGTGFRLKPTSAMGKSDSAFPRPWWSG